MTVHLVMRPASVPDVKRIDTCKGCKTIDEIEETLDLCLACCLAASLAVVARRKTEEPKEAAR